jgi:uncharacterized protein YejL (UPF0352 family)
MYSPYTETCIEDLLSEYEPDTVEQAVAAELAALKEAHKLLTELQLVIGSVVESSVLDHHLFRDEKRAITQLHERLPRQLEDNRNWIQTLREEQQRLTD